MKQLNPIIGWLLLVIALGLYCYGIYWAIFLAYQQDNKMVIPEPLDYITVTLGAILLTNLGAVLGISITNKNSALATRVLMLTPAKRKEDAAPLEQREVVQLVAVVIYLISLVACFFAWLSHSLKHEENQVAEIVIQNGKSLIGVIAAYLAFVLGVKSNN